MARGQECFGQMFDASGTATTTETTTRWTASTNPIYRVRKASFTNDGAVDLLIRCPVSADQITLAAGENILFNNVSDGFTVDAASGTCAFRAHGEG